MVSNADVACQTPCEEPGVWDQGLLSEIQVVVYEIHANQLRTDHAITRIADYLKERSYTPEGGFPDNAAGCIYPVAPGTTNDLSSWDRIDKMLDRQMTKVFKKVRQLNRSYMKISYNDILERAVRESAEAYEKKNRF